MALANIFGGGTGMELYRTGSDDDSMMISAAAAKGEELVNELILRLARAFRNEIVEAWNKGREQ